MSKELLPDFPSGPLDKYRKVASFDWKKLRILLETEEVIQFRKNLVSELQKFPICYPPTKPLSFTEIRHLALKRSILFRELELILLAPKSTRIQNAIVDVLGGLDSSANGKFGINLNMVGGIIANLGSARHKHHLENIKNGTIVGSFCLTEIGHGSNAKMMRTTATYDKATKEFILNTPDFEAAKCWAGILGQTATHSVVFAQLITPDGTHQGLHPFFVNVRDTNILLPCPGVTVGDMGEKIGLQGIDNGFLMFNNYRIPKSELLDGTGDISDDGEYIARFDNPTRRYAASLGILSQGRVQITGFCATNAIASATIGIRYAAIRKQFGSDGQEEIPILEYQTHQHRLIPYLSAAYVLKIFSTYLSEVLHNFLIDSESDGDKQMLMDLGFEIHAVSSASKPVSAWVIRDAIQECREACGGHGYLKAAGIGDLRGDHDPNCTYEGENHILIQQTSNWLLKLWPVISRGENVASPLRSINFLSNYSKIMQTKFAAKTLEDMESPKNVIDVFQWLVCYLLKISSEKIQAFKKYGTDSFRAKNESQVFYARNLAVAYIQHFFLQQMLSVIRQAKEPEIQNVLTKLFSLYGVWSLEKHLSTLYQGGYATGPEPTSIIQDTILKLCKDLKNDAVALVDAVAPDDFLLNSVLGKSDGLVYKHLQNSMMTGYGLSRPEWWEDILYPKSNLKSKM